ncbi:unnamed protein product [Lactuca virosa]|uniref:Uncharacterized protein n=1 Tax=Lactuca virosa TaxID=75947 RepID=A0AAU9P6R0_9ASTR|nr:unnamed protein product [Lactuca virosa]
MISEASKPAQAPLQMAIQHEIARQNQTKILDTAPFIVLLLIAAHVLALVYGIYKLATSKLPQRRVEPLKKRS